jgi:hypothetical protein
MLCLAGDAGSMLFTFGTPFFLTWLVAAGLALLRAPTV